MKDRTYCVYILASVSRVLYVGVTNDILRRVWQHKKKLIKGFTKRYNVNRLVWCEVHSSIRAAIAREKEIKGWVRAKKVALIKSANPAWDDLSEEWFPFSGRANLRKGT